MEYLRSGAHSRPDPHRAVFELDSAIAALASTIRDVEFSAAQLEARFPPPTDEQVDEFRRWFSQVNTPQWDLVRERIADGELTWRELAAGERDSDPGVEAAFRSTPRLRPPAGQPEPARSDPFPESASTRDKVGGSSKRRHVDDDGEDDDFTFRA